MTIPRERSIGEETFMLHCQALNITAGLEREWRFSDRGWRFDFAWPAVKLAVEIEGGVRNMGRHQRPKGFTVDCEKYNAATLRGWAVLRFTTAMVRAGTAIDDVAMMLKGDKRCAGEDSSRVL
jgi:very-short-patch-repair endonuclease